MTVGDFPFLLAAAWTTISLSIISIACGVLLGLAFSLVRTARVPVLSQFIAAYVSLGRATPLVTLVLFLFVILPSFNLELPAFYIGVFALTLNTATFNTEIWRAAYMAIPKAQIETAITMGMPRVLRFRRIILPQMLHIALPPLINEMTFLIKASPAVAVIGVVDLTRVPIQIAAQTYAPLPPLFAACVIYMMILSVLVKLQRFLEKRAERYTA